MDVHPLQIWYNIHNRFGIIPIGPIIIYTYIYLFMCVCFLLPEDWKAKRSDFVRFLYTFLLRNSRMHDSEGMRLQIHRTSTLQRVTPCNVNRGWMLSPEQGFLHSLGLTLAAYYAHKPFVRSKLCGGPIWRSWCHHSLRRVAGTHAHDPCRIKMHQIYRIYPQWLVM